jgi:hypothetical protein
MKTANISVLLNTPNGKKHYRGRGVVTFPFIVHRPISSWDKMQLDGSLWCISHMASGRQAFRVRTLKDAKRMIEVLGGFDLFLMPESDKFLQLCRDQGNKVRDTVKASGFSFDTLRFRDV